MTTSTGARSLPAPAAPGILQASLTNEPFRRPGVRASSRARRAAATLPDRRGTHRRADHVLPVHQVHILQALCGKSGLVADEEREVRADEDFVADHHGLFTTRKHTHMQRLGADHTEKSTDSQLVIGTCKNKQPHTQIENKQPTHKPHARRLPTGEEAGAQSVAQWLLPFSHTIPPRSSCTRPPRPCAG